MSETGKPTAARLPKIAVIWVSYGLYHVARARALSELCELHAIELAPFQRLYQWRVDREDEPFQHWTISQKAWEDRDTFSLTRKLWSVLSHIAPDGVLIAGYSEAPCLAAAIWAKLHGKARILMSESNESDYPRRAWKEQLKRTAIRRLYDGAVTGGKRSAAYAQRLGIPAARIGAFYDVVDNRYFVAGTQALRNRHAASDFGLPAEYFLCVARLDPVKNLTGLLRAYRSYIDGGGAWKLVIVGDGPLRAELEEAIGSLNLTNYVILAGLKQGSEILPYFAFASAFILPSIREPWGLVINEACNSALPLLVSNRCGCSEDLVMQPGNGFVFDPSDHDGFVGSLKTMSGLSAIARAEMGARSREIVSRYSPQAFAGEVLRIFASIRTEAAPAGETPVRADLQSGVRA